MLGIEGKSEVYKALEAEDKAGESTEAKGNAPEAEETTATESQEAGTLPEGEKQDEKPDNPDKGQKEWHERKRDKKTPQQRSDAAWIRLRKKTKEQEKEIAELRALLEKQNTPKDNETEEERLERIGERGYNKARLESLERERVKAQNEAFNALIEEQFPTEKDKSLFEESWQIGERNGTHEAINKDSTIRNFLAKSKYAPRLLLHFALKPEALNKLLDIDDEDRKKYELFALEGRLAAYLNGKSKAQAAPKTERKEGETQPSAREILGKQVKSSIIGRQTASASAKGNNGLSDEDIEKIHNRNRFGGLGFRG